jgi:hypothetical protein
MMQPFVSRRSLFAASILAVLGLAADPSDAGSDASTSTDAATDAASDSSAATDATLADAIASQPEAATDDASPDVAPASAEGNGFVQDDGGLPAYTGPNIFDFLCIERPDTTPFSYASVKAPYTTAADCKAFAPEVGHATARACFCDSCFTLQQQCDALAGCRSIQKCSFDTGCHDSNTCYLAQGLCAKEINNAGTGSVSTALSQEIETCGNSHMCPPQ